MRRGRPSGASSRKRAVLAAGAIERPIAFAGNDRPGVMLAAAVRSLLNRFGVGARPGGGLHQQRRRLAHGGRSRRRRRPGGRARSTREAGRRLDARAGPWRILTGATVTGTRGRRRLEIASACAHGDGIARDRSATASRSPAAGTRRCTSPATSAADPRGRRRWPRSSRGRCRPACRVAGARTAPVPPPASPKAPPRPKRRGERGLAASRDRESRRRRAISAPSPALAGRATSTRRACLDYPEQRHHRSDIALARTRRASGCLEHVSATPPSAWQPTRARPQRQRFGDTVEVAHRPLDLAGPGTTDVCGPARYTPVAMGTVGQGHPREQDYRPVRDPPP